MPKYTARFLWNAGIVMIPAKWQSTMPRRASPIIVSRSHAATGPNKKEIIELDKEIVDLDPEVVLDDNDIPDPGDIIAGGGFGHWIAYQQQRQKQRKVIAQSRATTSYIRNRPVVPPLVIPDIHQHCGQLLRS